MATVSGNVNLEGSYESIVSFIHKMNPVIECIELKNGLRLKSRFPINLNGFIMSFGRGTKLAFSEDPFKYFELTKLPESGSFKTTLPIKAYEGFDIYPLIEDVSELDVSLEIELNTSQGMNLYRLAEIKKEKVFLTYFSSENK